MIPGWKDYLQLGSTMDEPMNLIFNDRELIAAACQALRLKIERPSIGKMRVKCKYLPKQDLVFLFARSRKNNQILLIRNS